LPFLNRQSNTDTIIIQTVGFKRNETSFKTILGVAED